MLQPTTLGSHQEIIIEMSGNVRQSFGSCQVVFRQTSDSCLQVSNFQKSVRFDLSFIARPMILKAYLVMFFFNYISTLGIGVCESDAC